MRARTTDPTPASQVLSIVAASPASLLWVMVALCWLYEWIPGTGEPPEPTWTSIGETLLMGAGLALVGACGVGLWTVILQPRLTVWSRGRRLLLAAAIFALASGSVLAFRGYLDWEYRAGFQELPFVFAGPLVASAIQLVRLVASLRRSARPDAGP